MCESLYDLDEATWESSLEPGKWSIKSIVSHMMWWDRYFYEEAIHKIAIGEPITLVHRDFDEFNRDAAEYAKTVPAVSLLDDAIHYRKKIIEDIQAMSEEQTVHPYTDGDGNKFQVTLYLKDFIWHDQHHMIPLQKYLQDRAARDDQVL